MEEKHNQLILIDAELSVAIVSTYHDRYLKDKAMTRTKAMHGPLRTNSYLLRLVQLLLPLPLNLQNANNRDQCLPPI